MSLYNQTNNTINTGNIIHLLLCANSIKSTLFIDKNIPNEVKNIAFKKGRLRYNKVKRISKLYILRYLILVDDKS